MQEYKISGSFICDKCRNTCKGGCHGKLSNILNGTYKEGSKEYDENKDLIGRKQIITCLGKYCDNKCEYNKEDYTPFNKEDDLQPLFNLIKWMGNKLHTLIEENKQLKEQIE